jgi:hypothetical protein
MIVNYQNQEDQEDCLMRHDSINQEGFPGLSAEENLQNELFFR